MPRYRVTLTYVQEVEAESEAWAVKDAQEIVHATHDQPDYQDVEVVRRDK